MANEFTEFDHSNNSQIYPLQNPIKRGYGVADPDVNPANRGANGMLINQRFEKIEVWIEEIEANFQMTGTTAQSRHVRQFMPHNIVQPTIKVVGRMPNSFQYNRLSSFVRDSHYNALHPQEQIREDLTSSGKSVRVETVRMLIRNGSIPQVWNAQRAGGRARVKGIHVPWQVEGYIKSMPSGAKRFDPAPQFEFEFFVAESQFKQGNVNIGMWKDSRVYGSELRPWLDWINKSGNFVTANDQKASDNQLDKKEVYGPPAPPDPGSSDFDPPINNPFEVKPFGE